MSSSSESSCAPSIHVVTNHLDEESSSELSSSEEKLNNCIPKSGQNNSIKRRHISSFEDSTSSDYSPPLPCCSKVTKQSNGGPSNAKQAEPITVQDLDEGTIWNVKCLNQLQEVEHALNSSSVRPKEVAISLNGDTEVPLPKIKLFLDQLRRTRCSVRISLLDSFLNRASKMQLERDEHLLKGLLKGRCRVVEFRGFVSINILKHLETLESLKTLGFGLVDGNDVRETISAMDKKFMNDVTTMHVSVSKHLNLKFLNQKIRVPPNKLCVAHFYDVDDDDVKVIQRILDSLFTTDSSWELQLHRVLFSLRGADALLGVMRDVGLKRAVVESLCLKPEERITMDSSCKKFNCKMIWT